MTEFNFIIDNNSKIVFIIPDLPQKCNYYYEPTVKLHKFDEVTVEYKNVNGDSIELSKDILNEIAGVFNNVLKKLISNKKQLLSGIKKGSLGYVLNHVINEKQDDDLSLFWVWSSREHTATLMYSVEEKIYMEIVPLYPWTFIEPSNEENYISFEEFMKNYKPYVFEVVDKSIAIKWQEQCEGILKMVDSDYLE